MPGGESELGLSWPEGTWACSPPTLQSLKGVGAVADCTGVCGRARLGPWVPSSALHTLST